MLRCCLGAYGCPNHAWMPSLGASLIRLSQVAKGRQIVSVGLFAAPCSHARVKPGPSQTNCQVSDSGCVVPVRDTGVASLAPRTRFRGTDSTHGGRRTLNVASPSQFAWLLIAPRHNT